jgi:hypothetical protein
VLEPGIVANRRASSLRACKSSGAVPVVVARARSAQNSACCSTTLVRVAASAVLVRNLSGAGRRPASRSATPQLPS